MEQVIAIIDLKSFYASCECMARDLDPFTTPLVCCDPYRGEGTVVMSATPYLKKKYGVPNVCRKKDLPNVPNMIFAQPRMSFYLQVSARIVSIFLDYVAEEDLHVYSVDESFLNLGPYLSLYQVRPEEVVQSIQKRIYKEFGITATAGIGPNMFLAKTALDQEGKKKPPYIAHWTYDDVPTKLWKIHPITKIWGISSGISSHLERIGIYSLKELAFAPISLLEEEFGIMGYQLHDMANGIDDSNMNEHYVPKERSLTLGQTLMRSYHKEEGRLLLLEMVDELCIRLRNENIMTKRVSLSIGFDDSRWFSKQRLLPVFSDSPSYLYQALKELYDESIHNESIRHISIAFSSFAENDYEQMTLFAEDNRERQLNAALDAIRDCYGANAVHRCSALQKHSTVLMRHEQIGGHRK